MRKSIYPQVKAFVMRNELDPEKVKLHVLQRWIYNMKEMVKKADKRPKNNIRRYYE